MTLLEIYNIETENIIEEAKMKAEVVFNKEKIILDQVLRKLMFGVTLNMLKYKNDKKNETYITSYEHVLSNNSINDSFRIGDTTYYISLNDYVEFYNRYLKFIEDDFQELGLKNVYFYVSIPNQNNGSLNIGSLPIINVQVKYELI